MPSQKGRDLLLKAGDGAGSESFATIGAARAVSMVINNQPVDSTTMDSNGFQSIQGNAGVQTMELALDGLFKDTAAEEMLRLSAFNRTVKNYQLLFPNGDLFTAAFVISDYRREGNYDGLETFSATFIRSGSGTFTTGA